MQLSVITINLNNVIALKDTIESVIAQTYKDFEYIIVDGGSTDGSLDVIRQFNNNGIDHWVSGKDNGIYDAMNKGIEIASGQYIYFLNAGDFLHDDAVLGDMMTALNRYNFPDIIFGNLSFTIDKKVIQKREHCDVVDVFFRPINHQTILASKRCLIDKFDTRLKLLADYNWFLSQLIKTDIRIQYVNRTICFYDTAGFSTKFPRLLKMEINEVRERYFRKHYVWIMSRMKGTSFMYLLKLKTIKKFLSTHILKKNIGRNLVSNV